MTNPCSATHARRRTAWDGLRQELDAWAEAGRAATLWWRDDDVRKPGPHLDRLLGLTADTPIALAVIPVGAGQALADRLLREPHVTVLQHGFDHRNHAPAPEKSMELGPHRALGKVLHQLAAGHRRLQALFRYRFTGILAPPWNRIGDAVAARLNRTGTRGLSGFGHLRADLAMPQINAHVDIVDWRGTRGFVGEEQALAALVRHLELRRTGGAAAAIPSGLLTHHRDNNAAAWRFLARLVDTTRCHQGARWVGVGDALRMMDEGRKVGS